VDQISKFMKPWKVRAIEALPNNSGVEIEFGIEGRPPIRFKTRQFGIGRRNAKSAALARFASKAGYGKPEILFKYLATLPRDLVGNVFPAGPVGLGIDLFPTGLEC
jgi:hypothetical protein